LELPRQPVEMLTHNKGLMVPQPERGKTMADFADKWALFMRGENEQVKPFLWFSAGVFSALDPSKVVSVKKLLAQGVQQVQEVWRRLGYVLIQDGVSVDLSEHTEHTDVLEWIARADPKQISNACMAAANLEL